ncbi:MAG: DUF5060 domain-containing protein [Chloroflexi bacterium]|nr:DUF5060 domain-containing protein [Chloroflexota bacterium]
MSQIDDLLAAGARPPHVGRWDVYELTLRAHARYANPFQDVRVTAVFTAPDGRRVTVAGFHDGGDTWRVRIAPDQPGAWAFEAASEPADAGLAARGELRCIPGVGRGFVGQHPDNPYAFADADGTPLFHLGDTCYPLAALPRAQRLAYLERRRAQGFSHVRFQLSGGRFRNSPVAWSFGGTPLEPDLHRYNPAYFQRLDGLLSDVRAAGLLVEVILLDYYRYRPDIFGAGTGSAGPRAGQQPLLTAGWTPEREEVFLRYVLARYASDRTVLYWTICNEYEVYPDGQYRFDEPQDSDWAKARAALVRALDPYRGAMAATVHPASSVPFYGRLFGEGREINPLLVQLHGEETRIGPGLSDGSGAGLETKLLALRRHSKPVVDGEFGYETNGYTGHGVNTTTALQRRNAWRIYLAGAWASAGFRSTVWNFPDITWDLDNNGGQGQRQLAHLARFFQEHVRYWELVPAPELVEPPALCAAVPGRQYVVYFPEGGATMLDLTGAAQPLAGAWFDPRTGTMGEPFAVPPGERREFLAPDGDDWVLLVTREPGLTSSEAARAAPITVEAPEDGGAPREPWRIPRNGAHDFTVEGYGYTMVEVVNHGPTPQRVLLRGFASAYGRQQDRRMQPDAVPEQYLYVRPPDGPWRRVYREGPDRAAPENPFVVEAPPSRTRVCTVVNITYREYVEWIESLPDGDPRLTKEAILTSANGRFKVYRLRITNPGGANKLRIAFCKTSHAYEQSGFYMAQGIVEWLLSGDPAANLDRVEWTVYPCLDPQAIHDGNSYTEYDRLRLDYGRTQWAALWHYQTGELPAQRYHVLNDEHMWGSCDYEAYKYNDPFAPSGPAGNGQSEVERVLLGFWPYWYEFGIDHYDHENKWVSLDALPPDLTTGARPQALNALPQHFGGALVTHQEIPFYGKDDVDPRQRLREQGRLWARSHSQAYLRMQRNYRYWTDASPGGPVDVDGAVFLPVPQVTLLEDLTPLAGTARPRANGNGGPMRLHHEGYEHGVGMRAGGTVTYAIPEGANTFRAMAGVDDGEPDGAATAVLVVRADARVVWRSRTLRRGDRQMVYVGIAGGRELTLAVEGPPGALGNWGGAKLTCDDPEQPDR